MSKLTMDLIRRIDELREGVRQLLEKTFCNRREDSKPIERLPSNKNLPETGIKSKESPQRVKSRKPAHIFSSSKSSHTSSDALTEKSIYFRPSDETDPKRFSLYSESGLGLSTRYQSMLHRAVGYD